VSSFVYSIEVSTVCHFPFIGGKRNQKNAKMSQLSTADLFTMVSVPAKKIHPGKCFVRQHSVIRFYVANHYSSCYYFHLPWKTCIAWSSSSRARLSQELF